MSLLDGGIREIFGAVFADVLLPGTLYKTARTDDGMGGWTPLAPTYYPVRGQIDAADEAMRTTPGYVGTDAMLIVLQAGVPVTIDTDDEIAIGGSLWSAYRVRQDPAASHWIIHGRRKRAATGDDGTDTGGTA